MKVGPAVSKNAQPVAALYRSAKIAGRASYGLFVPRSLGQDRSRLAGNE